MMSDKNVTVTGFIFLLIAVVVNSYTNRIFPTFTNFPLAPVRLRQNIVHNTFRNRHTRISNYSMMLNTRHEDTLYVRGAYLYAKIFPDDGRFQRLSGLKKSSSSSFTLSASKFKNFEEMLHVYDDIPVVVTFSSPMCQPCKSMSKEMDHVRDAMEDNIKVFNVDTDRFPDLGSRYNVEALPCTLVFKNGITVGRIQGMRTAQDIIQQIRKLT